MFPCVSTGACADRVSEGWRLALDVVLTPNFETESLDVSAELADLSFWDSPVSAYYIAISVHRVTELCYGVWFYVGSQACGASIRYMWVTQAISPFCILHICVWNVAWVAVVGIHFWSL